MFERRSTVQGHPRGRMLYSRYRGYEAIARSRPTLCHASNEWRKRGADIVGSQDADFASQGDFTRKTIKEAHLWIISFSTLLLAGVRISTYDETIPYLNPQEWIRAMIYEGTTTGCHYYTTLFGCHVIYR